MKILIVEDDGAIAQRLQLLLGDYNYAVDIARDGEEALRMADAFEYHLVLLDVWPPRLKGLEVCHQLRKQGFRQPILLLTGQGEAQQKAIALNNGADDYGMKPLDNEELITRIQALLRRGATAGEASLTWGHLSLDPNTRRVAYRDQNLMLTPKEYAILELLLRHPETVFSARAILDQAWSSVESSGEKVVRCHIKDLRQKLMAVGAPKGLIKTVYRVGYCLNPFYSFVQVDSVEQDGVHSTPSCSTESTCTLLDDSSTAMPVNPSPTTPQVAELLSVNEELRVTLEELHVTLEQLQLTQHQLEQKNQELQAARDQLEQRVADRTAELSQREAFLNSIYDGAAQSIFVVEVTETDDFRYVSFNHSAQQSTGLRLQDIQNRTPEEIFGCETGSLFRRNYERCVQAGSNIVYEDHFIFQNRPIWTFTTLSPLRNATGRIDRIVGTVLDISDRKHATSSLQQSEAKFRHFAENSHAVIWIADPQTLDCIYVSPAYEAIWGRSCQSLLDAPQSWLDALHPDDRNSVEATLRQKRKENTSFVEYRIVRPDGTIRWIEDRGFIVRDEQGQIYSYAGIAEDISDRKQAELTLQQQVRQEFMLADIAQEIRQSLDLDQILHSTVERVRAWLACDRVVIFRFHPDWQGDVIMESVGAEGFSILSTTISDPCFRDHYLDLYRQGRVGAIPDIHTANLEPCYVELLQQLQVKANLVVPVLQNDHLWGLLIAHHCTAPRQWQPAEIAALKRLATQVGIAIQQSELYQQIQLELSDRQQAEQKIREQAALLDIATDAILVCDLENLILYWNQGAERLYGWQAEEALGQKVNTLLSTDLAATASMKQTVLERGEWHGEIQQVTKTGKPIIVESRWTLVRDEAGQPKSILAVDTDITEKKSLEAQFYQAQRLESLGTLTSGIAHDLNNALTPVLSIAHLLRIQQSGLSARSQEMLKLLEASAQRGANMVKQILTFTRGTGDERSPVDVALLLQEVVKVAQQTFPKFITIHGIVPAQEIWRASANATQLHQVLMNLCVNARDAMPQGGTLTLSVENFEANEIFAQMTLDAHVGPYILITVADTGTGIAPGVCDRIFEPFFTTKAHGQGTGLGLSTVLGIVRSYGGFIQVASEVGKGTRFKVYLPAIETETASEFQTAPQPLGQGELILLVDDEDPILQSTRAILETHHYRVLTANNGTEAIAIYAQHQQDIAVVLVDMMMPDMDGVTVIRVLQEINPQVRAIAVSGLLPQYQSSLEALGIKTHLNKPYITEDLLTSIHLQLSTFQTDSK